MRFVFASLIAAVALLSALAPSPARAESPAPIDCSSGCYIITCNAQQCSLWRCDAKGCHFVTGWDREVSEGPMAAGRGVKEGAPAPEVAYASVCLPGKRCDLYELTATEALRLGTYDNIADLVGDRAQMRSKTVRQK